MMKRSRIAPLLGAGAAFMFAALAPVQADTAAKSLQPYTARYQVSYRGLNGGEIDGVALGPAAGRVGVQDDQGDLHSAGSVTAAAAGRELVSAPQPT